MLSKESEAQDHKHRPRETENGTDLKLTYVKLKLYFAQRLYVDSTSIYRNIWYEGGKPNPPQPTKLQDFPEMRKIKVGYKSNPSINVFKNCPCWLRLWRLHSKSTALEGVTFREDNIRSKTGISKRGRQLVKQNLRICQLKKYQIQKFS